MATKIESYNNLIDAYLKLQNDPEHGKGVKEQFVWIIGDYFFKKEKESNRSFELFLNNAFDKRASQYRYAECDSSICLQPYEGTNMPRLVGVRFAQKF